MQVEETTTYKGYPIYLNKWDEYCVLDKHGENMVTYNSGFGSLKLAIKFINKIYLRSFDKQQLEKIAREIKK